MAKSADRAPAGSSRGHRRTRSEHGKAGSDRVKEAAFGAERERVSQAGSKVKACFNWV